MEMLIFVVTVILVVIFWRIFAALLGVVVAFLFFLFVLGTLNGCVSVPVDPDVKAYNEQASRNNWEMCALRYKQAGIPTVHDGHIHDEWAKPLSAQKPAHIRHVRADLRTNKCRRLLGDYWEEGM
jgi:MFS superfamily sulfate permease-like transporter